MVGEPVAFEALALNIILRGCFPTGIEVDHKIVE